jgi:peptide/nickel transport system ATP-binding protein
VDGVSFNIRPGTIFGLVGESGSGKTTVGRTLLGLYEERRQREISRSGAGRPDRACPARHPAQNAAGVSGSLQLAEPAAAYWRRDGEAMLQHKLCTRDELSG